MKDVVLVAVIAAIPGTVAAILGLVNHGKLDTVKIEINGRMSELLALTAKTSHAAGVTDEKERIK